ncbi:MAG: pilus assembly protein [Micavibrio sp.]|nr:MAG: pilus assembly protein [Micavibrio sp.]
MIRNIKQRMKRFARNENGATAVEFALVSVLFLSVVFAIMEFGRFFWISHQFQFAVEDTTRSAAVRGDMSPQDIEEAITEKMSLTGINAAALNINVAETQISGVNFIEVTGHYDFKPFLPVPGLSDILTVNAASRMPTRPDS